MCDSEFPGQDSSNHQLLYHKRYQCHQVSGDIGNVKQIYLVGAKLIMKISSTVFMVINSVSGIVCIPNNKVFFKIKCSIQTAPRKKSDN